MRKLLLLLFLVSGSIFGFAQQKKVVTKPVAVKPVSELVKIKKESEKWFEIYVEINFKDKYSYKLLNNNITPVTFLEAYTDSLEKVNKYITNNDTTSEVSLYSFAMRSYRNNLKIANEEAIKGREKNDDYYKRMSERTKESANSSFKTAQGYAKAYSDAVVNKGKYEQIFNSFDEKKKKEIACYKIRIDCYANNSYGNAVLGKYLFHVDRKGVLIGELDDIIKIN